MHGWHIDYLYPSDAAHQLPVGGETWPMVSIRYDIAAHARLELPAYDFPIEQIQHNRQIQPAFVDKFYVAIF